MELNELQVGKPGPGATCDHDPFSGNAGWIGCHRIHATGATGGHDDSRCDVDVPLLPVCRDHAGDPVSRSYNVDDPPLENRHQVTRRDSSIQCPHDLGAGGITIGVDDSPSLMTTFPTKQQLSLVVAIELGAHLDQSLDGGGATTRQSLDGGGSGQTTRSGKRVFGMGTGGIIGGEGSRNASLGPPRRAGIRRRDHICPLESQRSGEPGDARPDDQRGVEA